MCDGITVMSDASQIEALRQKWQLHVDTLETLTLDERARLDSLPLVAAPAPATAQTAAHAPVTSRICVCGGSGVVESVYNHVRMSRTCTVCEGEGVVLSPTVSSSGTK